MKLTNDFYTQISDLETDTFWVLATTALRNSSYEWSPESVSEVLGAAGYLRRTGEPFSKAFVQATSESLQKKKWAIGFDYGTNFLVSELVIRSVRQYLLAHFNEEADHLAATLLKQYGRRGKLYYNYSKPDQTDKYLLKSFAGKTDVVGKILNEIYPAYEEQEWGGVELECDVCGDEVEAASLFLPPYPPGFLAAIPKKIRFGIAHVFAQQPQIFLSQAHSELWGLVEQQTAKHPQLVVRAAMNFLPNLPPGAGADLWERFPDLAIVAGWAAGRDSPANDQAFFDPCPARPNLAWHLRAVARMNANQVAPETLRPAFSRLKYLQNSTLAAQLQAGQKPDGRFYAFRDLGLYALAINFLTLIWIGEDDKLNIESSVHIGIGRLNASPTSWLYGQLASVMARITSFKEDAERWQKIALDSAQVNGHRYFDNLMEPPAEWETFLNSLEVGGAAAGAKKVEQAVEGDKRIIYVYDAGRETLLVREQKMGKKGWSAGRKIEWSKFADQVTALQDKAVVPALRTYRNAPVIDSPYMYWDNEAYKADVPHALYLLAGHPHVFEDDRKRVPLTVETAEPQLLVDHDEDGNLTVRMEPPALKEGYTVRRAGPGKLVVYQVSESLMEITKHIPETGMTLPAAAAGRFERVLPRLRKTLDVQSSTDWMNQDLPEVMGLPLPCFHLVPLGDSEHRLEIFIKPIPEGNFYFRPNEGLSRSLIATEAAGRSVLVRTLEAENAAVKACLKDCPTLSACEFEGNDALLGTDRQTLEVLHELQALTQTDRALLEYPKGQRLRLGQTVDEDQLQVQVASGRDWFRVEAGLQLDEERVIDFELILEGLRNKDKYVKIGEDEYLTLTESLKQRLHKMDGLLHHSRGSMELAPLAGTAFAEALEGLEQVQTDADWQDNLERMAQADKFVPPPPPAAFKAELRDYQLTGYEWLLRLAEWGVGACLADDMGLGKTIQALAVLTERAAGGPALVIAPASVIRNWRTETERFAPTLTPKLIASAAEAKEVIAGLMPGDIALLSFGLLTYISESLLEANFHTLVVDEAQAIKNPTTQRARVVRDLPADWKVATTGTPIENNLAELWSLFRFLNPGLFGSYARFRQQYETPIVKHQDEARAEQLRRIARPFILRRRKDDVLKELPPKTEIVRTVEPGPEEKSLYEALRRKALRDIDDADQMKRRFVVLQQLTQLRQAACHPKLLNKKSKVPSAKLVAVGETIQEILAGGHKALVFSQFVGHLKLVEKWVKSEKISYQYLDGSTPGKTRQKRVEAFQDGEGELFLISLKAGGTGLNLTAADYVLHLDPWWNPAVEDQASDRAHRMGQQNPVTVYRFVSEGTIEEQILELHAAKRDLADRLLAGTDGAGKLSVDDVVKLLREG
ncbi:DEAD/DEAH box helicase [Neolewinella aurantiaca]|uniref:DEAD/DEAH box helicase n=1 Tax=Neolewinella aurantiaca TaxID=2602767 RepID=A0A5C7F8T6_9BACT|nr:DEAD/DEAH box helicase [Neolewinella aurantiaca]TXF87131.1 DEAD/DEAH box helicase [Neolewinella aurantiaca]